MKIHLFRSSELDQHKFISIHDLLSQFPGPVQYVIHENPVEYLDEELNREVWDDERIRRKEIPCKVTFDALYQDVSFFSWETIFNRCEEFRHKHQIPIDEPVVYLTKHANEYNWFSSWDPEKRLNFFVHCDMWDIFVFTPDIRYPVAYELASIPLQMQMFNGYGDLVKYAHREPRGCVNDLCETKSQIELKLRTGDICSDCRKLLNERKADIQVANQVFRIFEGIRNQFLFSSSFTRDSLPSRLLITRYQNKIILTELANLEIPLNPMEKTVFHFFLNHPGGVAFLEIPKNRDEIYSLYNRYSNTDMVATMHNRVNDLCSNLNDCLSQHISRIRRKFEDVLPGPMAAHYVIGGDPGRKRRILIDRSLVTIET